MKDVLRDLFRLRGLSRGQKAVVWWFAIAFCLLCMSGEAPVWFFLLVLLNMGASGLLMRDLPFTDCFPDDYGDGEDDEEDEDYNC